MKKLLFTTITIFSLCLSSCESKPSLCDCLTTGGDLPSGCEQVFKDKYGTTDPSTSQMKNDYYKCKQL